MNKEAKDLIQEIVKGIQEKKGKRIVIADLKHIHTSVCDYLIICQGNSPSQVEAIVESVSDFSRIHAHTKPTGINGLKNAQWVVMDYSNIMVHIFLPEERDFYDLEHLWADATLTNIPDLD
jgi:ribosome-associated protein